MRPIRYGSAEIPLWILYFHLFGFRGEDEFFYGQLGSGFYVPYLESFIFFLCRL